MVHGLLLTLREKQNMFELNGPNFRNQKEFRISEVAFFQSTFKNIFLKFKCPHEAIQVSLYFNYRTVPK